MTATTSTDTALPAGTWKLDTVHSSIAFSVHYMVARYRSGFSTFDATLTTTDDGLSLEGTADVASIEIGMDAFREHLLSADYFDAARHPQIRFAASEIRRAGDRVEMDGELALLGTTLPLAVTGAIGGPAPHPYGATVAGLTLQAVVDRAAFGMRSNIDMPDGKLAIANDVTIEAALQFTLDER
jgi:polyisoprenoid-binding protein YceI